MCFSPRHLAIFAIGCIAVVLAACAAPRTMATFQTQDGTISLRQSVDGATYSVTVGPHTSLPLDGFTSAHVDSIWNLPGERLVLITGVVSDCRQRYTLVIAQSDAGSLHPVGECGDTYGFAQDANTITIRQTGVRNPKIWTFRDGALSGPTTQVVTRQPRPALEPAPSRTAEEAREATSPPAVSAPIGDEVIPSPVSASGPSRTTQ
jgi:hypothetical protein